LPCIKRCLKPGHYAGTHGSRPGRYEIPYGCR